VVQTDLAKKKKKKKNCCSGKQRQQKANVFLIYWKTVVIAMFSYLMKKLYQYTFPSVLLQEDVVSSSKTGNNHEQSKAPQAQGGIYAF
jgi:hypothetical protein